MVSPATSDLSTSKYTRLSASRQQKTAARFCAGRLLVYHENLLQEPVHDLVLSFLFGQAQGHQFDELLTGDFADSSFVDQAGVHAVGSQGRAGNDRRVVHNDGIALRVSRAGAVAVDVADELLLAHVLRYAAAYHVG